MASRKPADQAEEHAQQLISAQQILTRLDAGPDKHVIDLDPKFSGWVPYRVAKPDSDMGVSQARYLTNLGYVEANKEATMPGLPGGRIWVCHPRQHVEVKKALDAMAHQAQIDVNQGVKDKISSDLRGHLGDAMLGTPEVEVKETQQRLIRTDAG